MKAYADLEQSKKLTEILPIESADSYYSWHDEQYYVVNKDCPYPYSLKEKILCWSLAALLSVLPEGTRLLKSTNISSVGDTKYHCDCPKGNIDEWFDNPIDACVAMIEKLNEQKLL